MNNRRSISLVKHFLKNSPQAYVQRYKRIFKSHFHNPITAISDKAFLYNFLKELQAFGPPTSQLGKERIPNFSTINIFKNNNPRVIRPNMQEGKASEADQLQQCIKELSSPFAPSVTTYQELEQRIVIAQPDSIMAVRTKLTYLFKMLLNKRDVLPPQSFELSANIQLSQAIIQKFGQIQYGDSHKEWNKLQAMEKLLRAKQYKKKGLTSIAVDACQQIFRNDAATYQTRLEALKILCVEGEEERDVSKLEPLVSFASEKGEKEYQEYLMLVITRIKNEQDSKSPQQS